MMSYFTPLSFEKRCCCGKLVARHHLLNANVRQHAGVRCKAEDWVYPTRHRRMLRFVTASSLSYIYTTLQCSIPIAFR